MADYFIRYVFRLKFLISWTMCLFSLELLASAESSDFHNHPSRLRLETAINVSCLHYEGVQSGSCVIGCVSSATMSPFAPTPAFHFLSIVLNVVFQVWFLLQWKSAWPGLPNRTSVLAVHPVSKYSLCTDCLGGERADCFSSVMDGHWSEAAPPVVSGGHTWTNCQRSDGQCSWIGIVLVYCRNQLFSAFSLHTVTSHPPLFAQFRYVADACRDRGSSLGPSSEPTQTSLPRLKIEFDPVTG